MEFTGKIIAILQPRGGVAKSGNEWKAQEYVIEDHGQYPRKMCFDVFGADKKLNGGQAFSSYMEAGYTYAFNDKNALSLAVGTNLNKGFYTSYEKEFCVVNIALKYVTSFTFGKFKLPISASYILNPYKEKSYLTFSLYFNS